MCVCVNVNTVTVSASAYDNVGTVHMTYGSVD